MIMHLTVWFSVNFSFKSNFIKCTCLVYLHNFKITALQLNVYICILIYQCKLGYYKNLYTFLLSKYSSETKVSMSGECWSLFFYPVSNYLYVKLALNHCSIANASLTTQAYSSLCQACIGVTFALTMPMSLYMTQTYKLQTFRSSLK